MKNLAIISVLTFLVCSYTMPTHHHHHRQPPPDIDDSEFMGDDLEEPKQDDFDWFTNSDYDTRFKPEEGDYPSGNGETFGRGGSIDDSFPPPKPKKDDFDWYPNKEYESKIEPEEGRVGAIYDRYGANSGSIDDSFPPPKKYDQEWYPKEDRSAYQSGNGGTFGGSSGSIEDSFPKKHGRDDFDDDY